VQKTSTELKLSKEYARGKVRKEAGVIVDEGAHGDDDYGNEMMETDERALF